MCCVVYFGYLGVDVGCCVGVGWHAVIVGGVAGVDVFGYVVGVTVCTVGITDGVFDTAVVDVGVVCDLTVSAYDGVGNGVVVVIVDGVVVGGVGVVVIDGVVSHCGGVIFVYTVAVGDMVLVVVLLL